MHTRLRPRPGPRGRLRTLVSAVCCAAVGAALLAGAGTATAGETHPDKTHPADANRSKVVGYFTDWGIYDRQYYVKNIETSGSADRLTHINYAFGNVVDGKCALGDPWADTDKPFTAGESVDGVADTAGQSLSGNFNQLRKLKKLHPRLKVIWSFGGWSWSGGFGEAAKDPAAFARSCHDLVENPAWADVFDGIDIDWEYPNACGLTCDTSGREAFRDVMAALRAEFGRRELLTAAITADATAGGRIDAADYAGAARYLDWYNPMTYDYFGTWAAAGPTAPHSPLTSYRGIPQRGNDTATTIAKLKSLGIPSRKLLLGIGFYGRGWTGVTQAKPGGAATGPAAGTYEAGSEDYKVLKVKCPATGTVGGTAYAKCGSDWWSYDTPRTIATKMKYRAAQGLGGTFFWELSGDTANGELIHAIK
ncbi:glycoside hydrolase family 18 protein [Streptomyces asoensis]|uniref:chitinase n=1 Tax=Streptomyces asoensis TaxID=249586 RepID=A0ABQ3RUR3_9ACTN|nr:glycosyl hydrolase family 18 protein [Streptomyces asoensis]GGQ85319.1 chitinase [Streptomyces asoensis]GHI59615.1 chitinase [Streptomyces asoensis]